MQPLIRSKGSQFGNEADTEGIAEENKEIRAVPETFLASGCPDRSLHCINQLSWTCYDFTTLTTVAARPCDILITPTDKREEFRHPCFIILGIWFSLGSKKVL